MSDPTPETNQRALAARVLARTASPRRAAKKSGVDLDTIRAWTRDPIFQQMVVEVRTSNVMKTVVAIQNAAPIAAKALADELQVERPKTVRRGRPPKDAQFSTERPAAKATEVDPRRIRAAKVILELFTKFTEMGDLVHRIRHLEDMVTNRQTVDVPYTDTSSMPALETNIEQSNQ